jgi:hypothetical protein
MDCCISNKDKNKNSESIIKPLQYTYKDTRTAEKKKIQIDALKELLLQYKKNA